MTFGTKNKIDVHTVFNYCRFNRLKNISHTLNEYTYFPLFCNYEIVCNVAYIN